MVLHITEHIQLLPLSDEIKYLKNEVEQVKKLEPLSTKLAHYLLDRRNEVCSNIEIIDAVWAGNYDVGKPALRKNIYKLRNIFSEVGEKDIIQTIPKKGYKIVGKSASVKPPKKFNIKAKVYYIVGGTILLLITLKIIFPGIIHRLMH